MHVTRYRTPLNFHIRFILFVSMWKLLHKGFYCRGHCAKWRNWLYDEGLHLIYAEDRSSKTLLTLNHNMPVSSDCICSDSISVCCRSMMRRGRYSTLLTVTIPVNPAGWGISAVPDTVGNRTWWLYSTGKTITCLILWLIFGVCAIQINSMKININDDGHNSLKKKKSQ